MHGALAKVHSTEHTPLGEVWNQARNLVFCPHPAMTHTSMLCPPAVSSGAQVAATLAVLAESAIFVLLLVLLFSLAPTAVKRAVRMSSAVLTSIRAI